MHSISTLSASRRSTFFVGTLALCIILVFGCDHSPPTSGAVGGLTKVVLQADWYPQPEHGGFYIALVDGYYKDEGLEVTIRPGGPYVAIEQQVSAGAAQFGMGASDRILEALANGQELVAVAATMQHDPQGIMVRQNSPVHSFSDLNGRTVAVQPGATWFAYLVKRYQLTNVHEIPATFSPANFVADPNYIQQAFATSEPFFAHQAGVQTRILLTSDAGYNPYRVMYTTRAYLQQHPDIVGKFVRASIRGWRQYLKDPSAANATILKLNPALSPAWVQFSWQALKDGDFVTGNDPSGSTIGHMDPQRWQTMYQQLLDLKVIAQQFDPKEAYTLQFASPNSPSD